MRYTTGQWGSRTSSSFAATKERWRSLFSVALFLVLSRHPCRQRGAIRTQEEGMHRAVSRTILNGSVRIEESAIQERSIGDAFFRKVEQCEGMLVWRNATDTDRHSTEIAQIGSVSKNQVERDARAVATCYQIRGGTTLGIDPIAQGSTRSDVQILRAHIEEFQIRKIGSSTLRDPWIHESGTASMSCFITSRCFWPCQTATNASN